MKRFNYLPVSFFLVFILSLSVVLFGQRVMDLNKVWGDMRVQGKDDIDSLGCAVAHGDINGDGYMDILIAARYADPGGRSFAGEVYVIFGSSSPPSTIDLSTQSADITICGAVANGYFGFAVASGDVNGDGYDDMIISTPYGSPGEPARTNAGLTYIIFGSSNPSSTIDLNTQSANITVCGDAAQDWSGHAVASGNINGDAYEDVIIGAPWADPAGGDQAGKTYIIFGSSTPPSTIDLSTQSADFTISGAAADDYSGWAVATVDVNSNGYDDIIIGAYGVDLGEPVRNEVGETYVIFGSSSPPSAIDLSTQSANITVSGDDAGDQFGYTVASGNINGDAYEDVIIGAPWADCVGGSQAGETYVIFGSSTPPSTIDLSTSSADITVCGAALGDYSGRALASGDVDGDGCDDLIIGAYLADPEGRSEGGESYVIFGSSTPPSTIDLNTQSAEITVCGGATYDFCGCTVASGDINGDGYYDVIIGADGADPGGRNGAGEITLIAGGGDFITAHGLGGKSWIKEFSLLTNGLNSFKAFGSVNSQGEVHLAVGDVDADSLHEIAAGQGEGGKSWVKFFEVNGSIIYSFKAFGATNTNGELHMTIGNFDADLSDNEIAIAQGEGGQSWVKLFEADGTFIRSIKAFGAANAQGEVHLASGDLENADGIDEIVAGMGEGGSSRVKIFSYDGTVIRSFGAFDAADNPGGEVRLAVGNFDADVDLEIAVATGYNGGNKVRLFEKDGTLIKQFLAFGFGGNTNGDVQITAADIVNDGIDEILCAHGEGGVSQVKVFKADGTVVRSFKAFGGVNAQGEVHIGKSNY